MNTLLLIVALAPLPAQQPDTAFFITRLGRDTLAVERFTFDGRVLDGVSVLRSPNVVVRRYRAVFGAGGGAESLRVAVGPAGRPGRQVTIYRYTEDSVVVESQRDTVHRREAGAARGRPLPFAPDMIGPWEIALRAALATGTGDVRLPMFADATPLLYDVHRAGGDTLDLRIANPDYGPLVARVDDAGRLQSLDFRATTDPGHPSLR